MLHNLPTKRILVKLSSLVEGLWLDLNVVGQTERDWRNGRNKEQERRILITFRICESKIESE